MARWKRRDSSATAPARYASVGLRVVVTAIEFLFDLLQRHVANIFAFHHENGVFADIVGVVANALESAHGKDGIQHTANAARVFHHLSDELAHDGFHFLVDFRIFMRHRQRGA